MAKPKRKDRPKRRGPGGKQRGQAVNARRYSNLLARNRRRGTSL